MSTKQQTHWKVSTWTDSVVTFAATIRWWSVWSSCKSNVCSQFKAQNWLSDRLYLKNAVSWATYSISPGTSVWRYTSFHRNPHITFKFAPLTSTEQTPLNAWAHTQCTDIFLSSYLSKISSVRLCGKCSAKQKNGSWRSWANLMFLIGLINGKRWRRYQAHNKTNR